MGLIVRIALLGVAFVAVCSLIFLLKTQRMPHDLQEVIDFGLSGGQLSVLCPTRVMSITVPRKMGARFFLRNLKWRVEKNQTSHPVDQVGMEKWLSRYCSLKPQDKDLNVAEQSRTQKSYTPVLQMRFVDSQYNNTLSLHNSRPDHFTWGNDRFFVSPAMGQLVKELEAQLER